MILTYVFTAIIMLISLIIQSHSSFDILRFGEAKPDLLFILIIYLAYNYGSFYAEISAFIGGLFHDAASNAPLGLLTLPKVMIAFILGFFGKEVLRGNIITIALLVFAASIIKGLITLILCFIFHTSDISNILKIILPEAFYNSFLAPILFFLYNKVFDSEIQGEGY